MANIWVLSKLLQNIFRNVNLQLLNQLIALREYRSGFFESSAHPLFLYDLSINFFILFNKINAIPHFLQSKNFIPLLSATSDLWQLTPKEIVGTSTSCLNRSCFRITLSCTLFDWIIWSYFHCVNEILHQVEQFLCYSFVVESIQSVSLNRWLIGIN